MPGKNWIELAAALTLKLKHYLRLPMKKRIQELGNKFGACLSTLMRRSRSMNFKVLHEYESTGKIKGFVLSCLSCEDEKIFSPDNKFVPYEKVADYPTDFKEMNKEDIDLLASRGEQITDRLVKRYLNHML